MAPKRQPPMVWDEQALSVHADSVSEILLFDLPPV